MKCPELCHTRSYVRDVHSFKLNEYSAVISSKYHAALIGFVQNTPTLCVYDQDYPHYKNKMKCLAEESGHPDCAILLNTFLGDPEKQVEKLRAWITRHEETDRPEEAKAPAEQWLKETGAQITQSLQ